MLKPKGFLFVTAFPKAYLLRCLFIRDSHVHIKYAPVAHSRRLAAKTFRKAFWRKYGYQKHNLFASFWNRKNSHAFHLQPRSCKNDF